MVCDILVVYYVWQYILWDLICQHFRLIMHDLKTHLVRYQIDNNFHIFILVEISTFPSTFTTSDFTECRCFIQRMQKNLVLLPQRRHSISKRILLEDGVIWSHNLCPSRFRLRKKSDMRWQGSFIREASESVHCSNNVFEIIPRMMYLMTVDADTTP